MENENDRHNHNLDDEDNDADAFLTLLFHIGEGTPVDDLRAILHAVQPNAWVLFQAVRFVMGLHRDPGNEIETVLLTMETLIQYDPQCTRIWDDDGGRTLLHYACDYGIPFSIIQLLIEHNSNACRLLNAFDGKLPLHIAVSGDNPRMDVIRLLQEHYPDGARVPSCGRLALHLVLDNLVMNDDGGDSVQRLVDVISLLLDCFPEAASHCVGGGDLALHLAYQHNYPITIIKQLVEIYPDALKVGNCEGQLPLHAALIQRSSFDIIEYLVQEYPAGVCSQTKVGNYPLHFASKNESSDALDIVKLLMKIDPGIVTKRNEQGELPLHCACYTKALAAVPPLLQSYPTGSYVQNSDGRLPLHHACFGAENANHVNLLLDACTESIFLADVNGQLPLHLACVGFSSVNVLGLVLSRYPDAIHRRDPWGKLPLHLACGPRLHDRHWQQGEPDDYFVSIPHIQCLLERDPSTLLETDSRGRTPLQLFDAVWNSPQETKQFLLNVQREAVQAKKQEFKEIGEMELGLPDLVVSRIWQFLKPDPWEPEEDYL